MGRSHAAWCFAGFIVGAVAGFALGTHFDLRSQVDWVAIGAVASFLVVVVALIPIGAEYRRRRHHTRSTRDHVHALLIEIDGLLDLRLRAPALGPFNPTEAAPIQELFALIPQLDLLEEAEARDVIIAAGKSRFLVLVGAQPQLGHQQAGFQDASREVKTALSVVGARNRASRRKA